MAAPPSSSVVGRLGAPVVADLAAGHHRRVREQRPVRREAQLADSAPAQFVERPVRGLRPGRAVDAGQFDGDRGAAEPVGEGEAVARLQLQLLRGDHRERRLDHRAVSRPGQPSRGDLHLGRLDRREPRQVRLLAARGVRQTVRAGGDQRLTAYGQPVEGVPRAFVERGDGCFAPLCRDIGADHERGRRRVPGAQ
ncbi:hypothetical protein [Streptomyces sp. NPDC050264]|uniref:hypothetical protein n=1 Tax=Streptomyces sp. NPDC050264 TaxID=3155038 RepID=UPI0034128641